MINPEESPRERIRVTEWSLEEWEPVKIKVAPTPVPPEIMQLIQDGIAKATQGRH